MAEKSGGLFRDLSLLSYGKTRRVHIYQASKDNINFLQRLELQSKLKVHNGCVNTTCWNDSGTLLLSGSDDQHLVVTNPYTKKVLTDIHTGHRANIFCARFLPFTGDNEVVSCSGDGKICYTNLEYHDGRSNIFDCHMATTYKVVIVPGDAHSFLSCGEDGTVRWFDLRIKTRCQKDDCQEDVLINCGRATCSLAVNPMSPWQLAAGCADSTIRIYDRRMLSTIATGGEKNKSLHSMLKCFSPPGFENNNRRITSITFDDGGQQILASYSSENVYLFDLSEKEQDKEFKTEKPLNGDSGACEHHDDCDTESSTDSSNRPLSIHKLRLRGDWSDTGPHARPERERQQDGEVNPAENIMQRMSTMLTRWLENHGRDSNPEVTTNPSTSSPQESPMHEITITDPENTDETVVVEDGKKTGECSQSAINLDKVNECAGHNIHSDSFECESRGKARENNQEIGAIDKIKDTSDLGSKIESKFNVPLNHEPSANLSRENLGQGDLSSHMCNVEEICDKSKCLEISPENQNDTLQSVFVNQENVEKVATSVVNSTSEIGTGAKPKIRSGVCPVSITVSDSQPSTSQSYAVEDREKSYLQSNQCDLSCVKVKKNQFSDTNDAFNSETKEMKLVNTSLHDDPSVSSVIHSKSDVTVASGVENRNIPDKIQPIKKKSLSQPEFNQTDLRRSSIDSHNSFGSDSEDERPSRTRGDIRPSINRNMANQSTAPTALSRNSAARRLQTMFRRHREEKVQKEEQERLLRLKLPTPVCVQCYSGHRNARTMIKEANFWGKDYVMCGSDCGHLFIWDRHTGKLVNLLEADRHVVNCVQPHPYEPILATSGIDYDVKLWAPIAKHNTFDEETANMVMERNRVMLRETRDTVTVPASFMLRLIASIHRVERARQVDPEASD